MSYLYFTQGGARFLIGVTSVPRSAADVSETYTGGLGLYLGSYTNREIGVVGREYSRSGGPSMGTSGNVPKNWMAVIT